MDIDGLRERLRTGRIATQLRQGAPASAHLLAGWRFDQPRLWIDADDLVGEVVDAIDRLNGRPDSSERCLRAIERYRWEPTEEHRRAIRATYDAVPRHLRGLLLGDQDRKDWPIRVLATDIGDNVAADGPTVTQDMHTEALAYFHTFPRRQDRP